MYKLYLDDVRVPEMTYPTTKNDEWVLVRSYDKFVSVITNGGLPFIVSFDHDLADEHMHDYIINVKYSGVIDYTKYTEKTGLSCAKWLVEYCRNNNKTLPKYNVHSANPIGSENIRSYLESYLWSLR